MNRRSSVFGALCFPLALLLGACSSSSNKTTDSAAGTVAVEAAPANKASADTAQGGVAAGTIAADADSNAADVTFAQGMIPHHQQAVEMSTIALDPARNAGLGVMVRHHQGAVSMSKTLQTSGKSAAAKELAGKIISAQEAELAEMNSLLAA